MSIDAKKILSWAGGIVAVISSVCIGLNWTVDKISERAVFTNQTKKTNEELPKAMGKIDTIFIHVLKLELNFENFKKDHEAIDRKNNEGQLYFKQQANKAISACYTGQ